MAIFSSKKSSQEEGAEQEQGQQEAEGQEESQEKKKNYKKQIEENVEFYKMPQNVKLGRPQKSSAAKQPSKEKKTPAKDTGNKVEAVSGGEGTSSSSSGAKFVGVLIMIVGILILGGAIYAGYYYFVAPSLQNQASPQQSSSESYDPRNSEQTDDNQEQQDQKQQEGTDQQQQEEKQQDEQQQKEDKEEEETSTTTEQQQEEEDKEETSTSSTSTIPEFADADDDGLSDAEEKLLGADVNDSDTDGDGYPDRVEILNLYNPLQGDATELSSNPNISEYSNSLAGYSLLYPADWDKQQMNQGESVFLKSGKGTFISIIVESESRNQTLSEWYAEKYPTSPYKEEPEMIEGENWKAMPHKNKKIFFLAPSQKERQVYVLTLSSEDNKSHHKYSQILRMVLNSFEFQ